ncbi:MAG: DNA-binding protein [Candidatus Thermoplasmatota archaeon]|nr:DNA-binding protein [Candidatus Thermoplasmatota archaeon]
MDDIDAIRKKKLQNLQQQAYAQEEFQEEQQKEFEDQKKMVLRAILTDEARERLGRIKVARPEVAENLENQLIMLAQSGRLKSKITDAQLRELLTKLLPKKRDITIRRRGI